MKTFVFWITFFSLFLYCTFSSYAVTVSISQYPSTITLDPFQLTASISGATNGTNYLRIDIYKEGTQSYFGATYNGSDWYGDSSYQSYLPVTIVSNKWSGVINGSIGSPNSSQYDGTGVYRVRLRRYTSGGTYTASEAEASSVVINIVTPTPTPFPTDAPTDTPIPTPISSPTNTPVPTPTKSPTPTKVPISASKAISPATKPSSIPTALLADSYASASSETGEILGISTSAKPTLIAGEALEERKIDWFPIITVGCGILILSFCGILFYPNYRKKKNNE